MDKVHKKLIAGRSHLIYFRGELHKFKLFPKLYKMMQPLINPNESLYNLKRIRMIGWKDGYWLLQDGQKWYFGKDELKAVKLF